MIIYIPVEEGREACIAWGKVRLRKGISANTPISVEPLDDGREKYTFNMNVVAKRVAAADDNTQMYFESANVDLWIDPRDATDRKRADCVKLLRSGDPVIVFGRHRINEWTDPKGNSHTGHNITADIVLPTAWLYDVLLALFAQVIAKAEPPTVRKVKDRPAPARQGKKPTVAHVNFIEDDEEWKKFE